VPLLAMVFIGQEPNGLVAKVMSFIPLFTPFAMMNRAGGPPATWEYVATSVLLVVTIWLVMRGAGKIFRVGVLMTGNPPKLREILGWLRQS
jgi:ABC-type Na+ efflux pump permease subunit